MHTCIHTPTQAYIHTYMDTYIQIVERSVEIIREVATSEKIVPVQVCIYVCMYMRMGGQEFICLLEFSKSLRASFMLFNGLPVVNPYQKALKAVSQPSITMKTPVCLYIFCV